MTPYWTENLSHSPGRKGRVTGGSTSRSPPAGGAGRAGRPEVSATPGGSPSGLRAAPARVSGERPASAARHHSATLRTGRLAAPSLECILRFIKTRVFARPVPRLPDRHRGHYVVQPIACQTSACTVGAPAERAGLHTGESVPGSRRKDPTRRRRDRPRGGQPRPAPPPAGDRGAHGGARRPEDPEPPLSLLQRPARVPRRHLGLVPLALRGGRRPGARSPAPGGLQGRDRQVHVRTLEPGGHAAPVHAVLPGLSRRRGAHAGAARRGAAARAAPFPA